MPTVVCKSPSICRVTYHRDTTDAKCMKASASGAGSAQLLQKTPTISRLTLDDLHIHALETQLEARVNSPEFQGLLQNRTRIAEELDPLWEQLNAETDPFAKTALKRQVKELHIQKLENKAKIEAYKDETAQQFVYPLTQLTADRIPVFEGDKLGNCVRTVSARHGSRVWQEQRQKGIGGSDIGPIIGTGDPRYIDRNYGNVFASKVTPITDEEVEEQSHENQGGAIGRGHTWEPRIFDRFREENPDLEVMLSKDSWVNVNDPRGVINVDGLISDTEDGVPNGIHESKTSSRPEDWAEGVPEGYKAQVLWYLRNTGFQYAYVSVMLDDHEYRQYRIEANDPVTTDTGTKPFDEYLPEIEAFWKATQEYKPEPEKIKRSTPQKSKFKNVTDTAIKNLSAYRDEDPQITRDLVQAAVAKGYAPHDVITGMYRDYDPSARKRNFAYVDLETTGFSDVTDEIIEFGVTVRNHKNEEVARFESLYSPDPRVLDITGTGAEEVHKITPDDVRGLPMFTDPASQAEIWEIMKDTIMVAHNAPFEDRFMSTNLKGFQEAGIPTLDTVHVSRYMVPGSASNSLESFAEHHGIKYENSHRALPDASMTAEALHAWQSSIRN